MYASLHIVIIYFEIRDLSLSIFGFNHTQKPHSPSQHKKHKKHCCYVRKKRNSQFGLNSNEVCEFI